MPHLAPIGTEIKLLISKTRGWTNNNGQNLRIRGTDGQGQNHHGIENAAWLRPTLSAICTGKEAIVCSQIYNAMFPSQGHNVQMRVRIGEWPPGYCGVSAIDERVDKLPGDDERENQEYEDKCDQHPFRRSPCSWLFLLRRSQVRR